MKKLTAALFSTFIGFSVANADTCPESNRDSQPIRKLNLSYPVNSSLVNPVDVQFKLDGNTLRVNFRVRAKNINAKANFGPKEYPYSFDVVELFLSVAGSPNSTYHEFELSPLGQTFEVRIDYPKKFNDNVKMGVAYETKKTADGWQGRMDIPLRNLGWDGDPAKLIGNAYAIQGVKPNKSYWSLFLPQQEKPNFHQPQFFRQLVSCLP